MSDLKKVSDEDLERELERRKREKAGNSAPKPLSNPDFSKLITFVVSGIEEAVKERRKDSDFEHYVYEVVMEAIYGKDFWDWWNKQGWNS